jgi:hypothetical protein
MSINNEVPYHKWLYAYEIKLRNPKNFDTYRFILHRFASKRERSVWLYKNNTKKAEPFECHFGDIFKRCNKVSFRHPLVQAAKHSNIWPCMLKLNSDDTYKLLTTNKLFTGF